MGLWTIIMSPKHKSRDQCWSHPIAAEETGAACQVGFTSLVPLVRCPSPSVATGLGWVWVVYGSYSTHISLVSPINKP
ncbi:hypothetical protein GOBAR_DD05698 [Gossypium barbadense]|nr:hypothetical protein GOBAR_DD05698 [Gossypium barbadense]